MPFKAKATLRMLALETSSVEIAREAVRSLLTDMGVESSLWILPSFDGAGKCFPNCLPLGDLDHMLHHVMMDGENSFAADNELWTVFDKQVNGLAKFSAKKMLANGLSKRTSWRTHKFRAIARRDYPQCSTEHVRHTARTGGILPLKFFTGFRHGNLLRPESVKVGMT